MKRFSMRDEFLWLGDECLYVTRPVASLDARLAWGRLLAECMDSERGIDGTHAFQRATGFGRLCEAIAVLVERSDSVEVDETPFLAKPGVETETMGTTIVTVGGAWDTTRLFRNQVASSSEVALPWERVAQVDRISCFRIFITGGEGVPLLMFPPDAVQWEWLHRSRNAAVRVGFGALTGEECHRIHLYRSGVLWATEEIPCAASIATRLLAVDVTTTLSCGSDLDWIPPLLTVERGGASLLQRVFCTADEDIRLVTLTESRVLTRLAECLHDCRETLRSLWDTRSLNYAFTRTDVSDHYVCLLDARELPTESEKHIRIAGQKILHIFCLSAANHRFRTVPVDSSRFSHLARVGALETFSRVCEFGALQRDGDGNACTILLPHDSTPTTIMKAVSLLCDTMFPNARPVATPFGALEDVMDATVCHAALRPSASWEDGGGVASMVPYLVRVDTHRSRLVLVRDPKESLLVADNALVANIHIVDDIPSLSVTGDPNRTRRHDIASIFPRLSRRIEQQGGDVGACVREAQMRRIVDGGDCSVADMDAGDNLNSRGVTVLLAILLAGWLGMRVRVFLGRDSIPLLGVWDETTQRCILVDAAMSRANVLRLCPHLLPCVESGGEVTIRKGTILEVSSIAKWYVARVTRVATSGMCVDVEYLATGNVASLDLAISVWRRLSNDASDTDRVVRSLLGKRKRVCTTRDAKGDDNADGE